MCFMPRQSTFKQRVCRMGILPDGVASILRFPKFKEEPVKKINAVCLLMTMCCGLALVAWSQPQPMASKARPEAADDKNKNKDKDKDKDKNRGEHDQDRNKQVVRQVFDDLFSRGRYDLVDKIYSPNCVVHSPGLKGTSLNEAVEEGKSFRWWAPDANMTVERIEARGDMVTVEWTARGKNTGKGDGIPATGKSIHIRGRSNFKLTDGKITEVTNNYDQNELFKQLGVNPRK